MGVRYTISRAGGRAGGGSDFLIVVLEPGEAAPPPVLSNLILTCFPASIVHMNVKVVLLF